MIRFPAMARLGNVAVIATLLLATALASFGAALAQSRRTASEAEYPLVGDEGQRLPNHTVRLLGPIDRLPGVVVVGNPKGKETLIEFYDLNCPFYRAAAADLGEMLKHDQELRLVLVPYPILGIPRSAPRASNSRWRNWARPSNSMNFIARFMRNAARPTARARSTSPPVWA
jgi:hypothetical protein